MPILEIKGPIDLNDPVLVIAISGWVDGGMVATRVGEHLKADGRLVAGFRPDDVFDYQSNRPSFELIDGAGTKIHWPSLTIDALKGDGSDVLVMTGNEPNAMWQEIADELAGFARTARVSKVVAVGAIPAMVAHTQETPIIVSSTDPALTPIGVPLGRLVVPAALVNVLSHQISDANGIPQVGFWAQVPHYVSGSYWPGVETVLNRLSAFLGLRVDLRGVHREATEMRSRLDEALANRPEAQQMIEELGQQASSLSPEDGANLTDEIETFLRDLGDDDTPFS
ncbi:MAG: PAC2 family protein [Acidimicrobiia bacterium]